MTFQKNMALLERRFPNIAEAIRVNWDRLSADHTVESENSRTDNIPTLSIKKDEKVHYIYSRYNPIHETGKLMESLQLEEGGHVIFFGFGLGYHAEWFAQRFPGRTFSVIEPSLPIFRRFLEQRDAAISFTDRLRYFILWDESERAAGELLDLVNAIQGDVKYVVVPGYKSPFSSELSSFEQVFLQLLNHKRFTLNATRGFEKAWVLNGLINMPVISGVANIFDKKSYFENRPAVIVSAGPSLQDEIEHLKLIKEHGLAYIFSVGSAVKALLSHGIVPDAALTYDPMSHNEKVFEEIIRDQRTDIPLIFGSNVYFEIPKQYPGNMFYFLTERDTANSYFSGAKDGLPLIPDATSIAIVSILLMSYLGCSTIILVGQNLAYRGTQFYASGIEYGKELSEEKNILSVEDVDGNRILTNEGFLWMKKDMEAAIATIKSSRIINTTKGGANIQGAPFIPMERLLEEVLTAQGAVDTGWLRETGSNALQDRMKRQSAKLLESAQEFGRIAAKLNALLNEMNEIRGSREMEQLTQKYNRQHSRFIENDYYKAVIAPMNLSKFEVLAKHLGELQHMKDRIEYYRRYSKHFRDYLHSCQQDYEETIEILRGYAELFKAV